MRVKETGAAPRIVDRPSQRMAVVETVGDPEQVGAASVGRLYGAITQLGLKSGPLRARWPNAVDHPRSEWFVRWALPVPEDTPPLGSGIALESWYGQPVAEVTYEGPFGEEQLETVKRLHRFIADGGYVIAGPAEEEYVTPPGEEPQRTIIRYAIRPADAT